MEFRAMAGCDGPTRTEFPIRLPCHVCFGDGRACSVCVDGLVSFNECVCRLTEYGATKVLQLWQWTERYNMMPHGGTPSEEPLQLMAAFQFIDRYTKALAHKAEELKNGREQT